MLIMFFVVGLGLTIGSFVNAVVWRLHEQSSHSAKNGKRKTDDGSRLSITRGRSMCPDCKHSLSVLDLIPVLSWLTLAGKCRYCHKPISVQYPLVELMAALLFGLSYIALRPDSLIGWVELGFWLYFLTALIILALYDLYWYILPDVVLLPAIVAGLVRVVVEVLMRHAIGSGVELVLAALAVGGGFYALAAVSKGRWMGGGDIKLVFLMGLLLGWSKLGVALMIAFNGGALIGVLLIAFKLKHRRDHIPFGPFLVGGTVIAALYGQGIINWYLRLMGYS